MKKVIRKPRRTKRVKVYNEVALMLSDYLYKLSDDEIRKLHQNQKEGEQAVVNAISIAIAGKPVEDDYLKLSLRDKLLLNMKLNKEIKDIIDEQITSETNHINDILSFSATKKYDANQYIDSIGKKVSYKKLSDDKLEQIVNEQIAGQRWSERTWKNKKALERNLRKDVNDLLQGRKTSGEIITSTRKHFRVNRNQSKRLVHTELARVQDSVNREYGREQGVRYQYFLATLDSSTSDTCQSLHGTMFEIDDAPDLPLHPNCRSALINVPDHDWRPTMTYDDVLDEYGSWEDFEDWVDNV